MNIKTLNFWISRKHSVYLQQVAADSENQISQQVAAKLFSVPWGHHMLLIDKVKDDYKKAWFYVCETVENGWSRAQLLCLQNEKLPLSAEHALEMVSFC